MGHTFKAVEHLSAAWLLIARPLSAAFPPFTSARISSEPGLSRFSSTKYTNDMMLKKVVYLGFVGVSDYAFISIWDSTEEIFPGPVMR